MYIQVKEKESGPKNVDDAEWIDLKEDHQSYNKEQHRKGSQMQELLKNV